MYDASRGSWPGPIMRQVSKDRFELCEHIVWTTQYDTMVTIPKSFTSNLASVPRMFWSIFPRYGRYTVPAIIHDFLLEFTELSREEADHEFYMALVAWKVPRIRRKIMYWGVRLNSRLVLRWR